MPAVQPLGRVRAGRQPVCGGRPTTSCIAVRARSGSLAATLSSTSCSAPSGGSANRGEAAQRDGNGGERSVARDPAELGDERPGGRVLARRVDKRRPVDAAGVLRGERGELGLDGEARVVDLAREAGPSARTKQRRRDGRVEDVPARLRLDDRAAAVLDDRDAPLLERAQRLAGGAAVDAVQLGDDDLLGQPLAGCELAGDDAIEECLDDILMAATRHRVIESSLIE